MTETNVNDLICDVVVNKIVQISTNMENMKLVYTILKLSIAFEKYFERTGMWST